MTPLSQPTLSEALEFVPYDPDLARLNYDVQQLGERQTRGRTAPIGTSTSLRAFWKRYEFPILLTLILLSALAAGTADRETNRQNNCGPECQENNR